MKNECRFGPVQVRVRASARIAGVLAAVAIALAFHAIVAQGQTAGCDPNGAIYPCVYVANALDSTVSVINASTNTVLTTPVTVPGQPGALAITPDNAVAYVAIASSTKVSLIYTNSNTLGPAVPLQDAPVDIAVTPDGTEAWVTETYTYPSGSFSGVEIIDTTTSPPTVKASIPNLMEPAGIAFTPDGTTAYVADTCTVNGQTTACFDKINVASRAVTQIPIPGTAISSTASMAVTPDGSLACMSASVLSGSLINFIVACINTSNNTVSMLPNGPTSGLVSPSDYGFATTPAGILYAIADVSSDGQIYLFNPALSSYNGAITVGNGPEGVAVSADGADVYVTSCCNQSASSTGNAGQVSVIDANTREVTNTLNVGRSSQGVAAMPSIRPAITTQPVSQTIDYGQSATLSVTAAGTAPFTYQWYSQIGGTTSRIPGANSSSYTTPSLTTTTNYSVIVFNRVAGAEAMSGPATITVIPYSPPAIATEPVSQAIVNGQTATLTVAATGTPPLAYQWYQGQGGNTSMPIGGATGSSYTTPALTTTTSYWVLVSTLVQGQSGSIASNTVTITVNHAPTCTNLALQGTGSDTSDFQTQYNVEGVVSCTDPQNLPITTSISWGDGSSSTASSQPDGTFTATHTYGPPSDPSQPSTYAITATATDSFNLQGTISNETILIPATSVNAVFPGQSINVPISLPWPYSPVQVTFTCTTVIDSKGNVDDASALGISCNSTPSPVTLSPPKTSVTINIQTTGSAVAATSMVRKAWFYAVCLPLPAMLFWCIGLGKRVSRRRILKIYGAQILVVGLLLQLVGCGGGFVLPSANSPSGTPPGSYQITIVDNPVNSNTSGFIQISLIVPLTVSQPQ